MKGFGLAALRVVLRLDVADSCGLRVEVQVNVSCDWALVCICCRADCLQWTAAAGGRVGVLQIATSTLPRLLVQSWNGSHGFFLVKAPGALTAQTLPRFRCPADDPPYTMRDLEGIQ